MWTFADYVYSFSSESISLIHTPCRSIFWNALSLSQKQGGRERGRFLVLNSHFVKGIVERDGIDHKMILKPGKKS